MSGLLSGALEKARGVKIKPGERVTRADGSVWEGRYDGPPRPVSGPVPQRVYHATPIRGLQHFDQMRATRTLRPRRDMPDVQGPLWDSHNASNPDMVYFSTQLARDPKKRGTPLAATIHEWSPAHLRLGVVFRNAEPLDQDKLYPDEDFVQRDFYANEDRFAAQRRLKSDWSKSFTEYNAPTIAHEGPVAAEVHGFTLWPLDARQDQFVETRDGPPLEPLRKKAFEDLRSKLSGARRIDGGAIFVPNTPENAEAIRGYVAQQEAAVAQVLDVVRALHADVDFSLDDRARYRAVREAVAAANIPPDMMQAAVEALTRKRHETTVVHESNVHTLAHHLAHRDTKPLEKAVVSPRLPGTGSLAKAVRPLPLHPPRPRHEEPEHPFAGQIVYQGLPIDVETAAGQVRSGTDPDGRTWSVKLAHHYGEVRGTTACDGDPVDVFLGPDPHAPFVYVVQAKKPRSDVFDEPKAMLGFATQADAMAAFRAAYTVPGFVQGVTTWPIGAFVAAMRDPELQRGRLDQAALGRLTKANVGDEVTWGDGTRWRKVAATGRREVDWQRIPAPTHAPPARPTGPDEAVVRQLVEQLTNNFQGSRWLRGPNNQVILTSVHGPPILIHGFKHDGRSWTVPAYIEGSSSSSVGGYCATSPSGIPMAVVVEVPIVDHAAFVHGIIAPRVWDADHLASDIRRTLSHELVHAADNSRQPSAAYGTDPRAYFNNRMEELAFRHNIFRDVNTPAVAAEARRQPHITPAFIDAVLQRESPTWRAALPYLEPATRRRWLRTAADVLTAHHAGTSTPMEKAIQPGEGGGHVRLVVRERPGERAAPAR